MQGSAYVGAYWGSRPEAADACARRAVECLRSLAELSPVLAQWKPKGRSLSEALTAVEIPHSRLTTMFERGVNREEATGSVIPQLGYSWSAWNGLSHAAAGVSVLCGAWTAEAGVPNSFVLDLPDPTDNPASPLYEREIIERMVVAVVQAWAPDWAVVTSNELRNARAWEPGQPVVGWITYLGPGRTVPTDLTGAEVTQLNGGSVVAVAKRWDDLAPVDLDGIAVGLDRAGALAPIV